MILINNKPITIKRFPNGEARIEKKEIQEAVALINWKDQGIVNITMQFESDADFFDLLLVRKALWMPVELHLPYFPYSRMDRKSDAFVFTLKSVGKFINWLDFAKVHIYEPHSDVTPAILNKCVIHNIIPSLFAQTPFNRENDYVLYPDASAFKKYAGLTDPGMELIGFKQRDFLTGKFLRMDIVGKIDHSANVFVVDDLCSKGGTFVFAATELQKQITGNLYLVIAHCESSIFDGKVFDYYDEIYTTNTIPGLEHKNDKLKIFDYTEMVGATH